MLHMRCRKLVVHQIGVSIGYILLNGALPCLLQVFSLTQFWLSWDSESRNSVFITDVITLASVLNQLTEVTYFKMFYNFDYFPDFVGKHKSFLIDYRSITCLILWLFRFSSSYTLKICLIISFSCGFENIMGLQQHCLPSSIGCFYDILESTL